MFKALHVAYFAIAVIILWIGRRRRRLPLPPGPPADPIIGHARMIPSVNQEVTFHEWSKTYGDIMHLKIPGRNFIVLSSVKVANELLDERGGIYSDRPRLVVLGLMIHAPMLGLLHYGKRFQKHRRLMHEYLNQKTCEDYRPMQMNSARKLLADLMDKPHDYLAQLERYAASVIFKIAYGHDMVSDNDPYHRVMIRLTEALTACGSPGGTPVDFLPFLQYLPRWFPGTYYAYKAKDFRPVMEDICHVPYMDVKKRLENGTAKPSYVAQHLQQLELQDFKDQEHLQDHINDILGSAGQMYGAGADTTYGTLAFFVYAMIIFPECQIKAQGEIDRVVGRERLPEIEDRESLPYVNAILHEVYRYYPVTPLGVPHCSTEDDIYNGMFIPKGSIIIANAQAMLRDGNIYSNPDEFNPSRYLPKPEGKSEPYPTAQFGFGRRICVGRYFADSSLWLAVSHILATFTIGKAVDDNGLEITPKLEVVTGITSHPKRFPCSIKPRDEAAESLVRNTQLWQD